MSVTRGVWGQGDHLTTTSSGLSSYCFCRSLMISLLRGFIAVTVGMWGQGDHLTTNSSGLSSYYFCRSLMISLLRGFIAVTVGMWGQGDIRCLFVLRLNVPVNNFSVMSGRSHRFLGN